MEGFNLEGLLRFLKRIVPGEINIRSLRYLLYVEDYTVKRMLNGKTKWR